MTAATGLAMAMRLQLARLAARHGVAPATPVLVPSTAPTDHPVVVEGLAATSDVDREVRPWCFPLLSMLRQPPPPFADQRQAAASSAEHRVGTTDFARPRKIY